MWTQLSASTSARVTNSSAVTGSSNSGSVTVSNRRQTSALRSAWIESRMACLLGSVDGFGEMCVSPSRLDLLLLRLNVDAVQSSGVKAQDLLLRLERKNRPGLLRLFLWNLEGHEFVDQPFRRPDAIVAAVQKLVWANPEQQLGHDMAEITGAGVNEGQRDSEAAVHVGFLRGDPAKIVKTRQAAVLNDEVQVLERCRDIVDIANIECVLIQRNDRWTLVNVDVFDAVFLRRLKELVGVLVGQFVALGVALPFRGVELDSLDMILLAIRVQRFQTLGAIARIEGAVENETIGMTLLHRGVAFSGVEAVLVEISEIGRLQYRHVVVSMHEQVVMHRLGVVFREFIQRPFLGRGTQIGMIGIEAFDELLAVNILLVGRAAVPKMRVPVDDEYLFTVRSPVHGDFSLSRHAGDSWVIEGRIVWPASVGRGPALAPTFNSQCSI